jgi:hypothetical protein
MAPASAVPERVYLRPLATVTAETMRRKCSHVAGGAQRADQERSQFKVKIRDIELVNGTARGRRSRHPDGYCG